MRDLHVWPRLPQRVRAARRSGGQRSAGTMVHPRMRVGRRIVVMVAAVLTVAAVQLAMPATANAATSSEWHLVYGNGETRGNVAWYNWTVSIGGWVSAPQNRCYTVQIEADGGGGFDLAQRTACSGKKTFGFDMTLQVPGGPDTVWIDILDNDGVLRHSAKCVRTSSHCAFQY